MKKELKILFTIILLVASIMSTAKAAENRKILIFVSLSMPQPSLISWMKQAKQAHARVIIRGLHQDSLHQTIQAIHQLTKKTKMGVDIDPIAFQKFQIEKVPAVVVLSKNNTHDKQATNFDVAYGNVTLRHALQIIAYGGSVASDVAMLALKEFESKKA